MLSPGQQAPAAAREAAISAAAAAASAAAAQQQGVEDQLARLLVREGLLMAFRGFRWRF